MGLAKARSEVLAAGARSRYSDRDCAQPLPPAPSPRRRGGEEWSCPPSPSRGGGRGEGLAACHPSPQPPPRDGEGERNGLAPPLRLGEGAGGGVEHPQSRPQAATTEDCHERGST